MKNLTKQVPSNLNRNDKHFCPS